MRRRALSLCVLDAEFLRDLGADEHLTGALRQLRVPREGVDDAAGELRRLGGRGKLVVGARVRGESG
ncbi:hypothetical protein [Nocardia brevicatena]|uniref:hypothetical protein n=1 Tax=Nocardia brevicatena TaxID=37327 RepID=UPI001FE22958|nr:hypothetical protein [Nocardia brevicatena]